MQNGTILQDFQDPSETLYYYFSNINQKSKKAVILIDEYDNPMNNLLSLKNIKLIFQKVLIILDMN